MPAPSETVVPDSSVTGPVWNKISPMISDTTVISRHAARLNTAIAAYLTLSSLVRPAGTVSRPRSVPRPASPAIESPEITAMLSGRSSSSVSVSTTSARNTPFPAS